MYHAKHAKRGDMPIVPHLVAMWHGGDVARGGDVACWWRDVVTWRVVTWRAVVTWQVRLPLQHDAQLGGAAECGVRRGRCATGGVGSRYGSCASGRRGS